MSARAGHRVRVRINPKKVSRMCETFKVCHLTRQAALDASERQMEAGKVDRGCHLMPYLCDQCGRWHLRNHRIVFKKEL